MPSTSFRSTMPLLLHPVAECSPAGGRAGRDLGFDRLRLVAVELVERHAVRLGPVVPDPAEPLLTRLGVDLDLDGHAERVQEPTVDLLQVAALAELLDRHAPHVAGTNDPVAHVPSPRWAGHRGLPAPPAPAQLRAYGVSVLTWPSSSASWSVTPLRPSTTLLSWLLSVCWRSAIAVVRMAICASSAVFVAWSWSRSAVSLSIWSRSAAFVAVAAANAP